MHTLAPDLRLHIAGAVGTSISVWAHDMARGLLDDGVPAGINAIAA